MLGKIKITDFALKHFDSEFGGTKILSVDPKEFEQIINNELRNYYLVGEVEEGSIVTGLMGGGKTIITGVMDGYAPFCKLLVIENFTDAKTGTLPITNENHQYIKSGYSARRDGEFAVLSEWIELPVKSLIPKAKYLIVILYDKNQINKELKSEYEKKLADNSIDSIGVEAPEPFEADWGIVAILGQMHPKEEPMKPITMMRNYMDLSMGGSGMKMPVPPVKPDAPDVSERMAEYNQAVAIYQQEMKEIQDKYQRSVDFWSQNVTVK